MKSLWDRLLHALNISGRDWVVLILSLLLAFSVWMIHNLSLKYNATLKAKVIAVCGLDGFEDVSTNSAEVTARCRATGYNILAAVFRSGRPVKVNFNPSVMQNYDGDRFFVVGSRLNEYAHLIFGEDVTLDHFISDTLFFRFTPVHNKKVPVVPVPLVTYKPQYMSRGELHIMPDSVVVEGEPSLLESVHQVYTTPIRHFDVSENISGVAALEPIRGINIETSEIYYSLEVSRYVEVVKEVPITVEGVPSDRKLMVFPSDVTVVMKCEFPLLDNNDGNVKVYVDYEDFSSSLGGNCLVKIASLPKGVISCEIDPVSVRCVEEAR